MDFFFGWSLAKKWSEPGAFPTESIDEPFQIGFHFLLPIADERTGDGASFSQRFVSHVYGHPSHQLCDQLGREWELL